MKLTIFDMKRCINESQNMSLKIDCAHTTKRVFPFITSNCIWIIIWVLYCAIALVNGTNQIGEEKILQKHHECYNSLICRWNVCAHTAAESFSQGPKCKQSGRELKEAETMKEQTKLTPRLCKNKYTAK